MPERKGTTVSQRVQPTRSRQATIALGAALVLLAPAVVRADPTYKIEPVIKTGDTIGDQTVNGALGLRGFNAKGQLLFEAAGGVPALLLSTDGKLTPLVRANAEGPAGPWSVNLPFRGSLNERGNAVFQAVAKSATASQWGTFFWDAASQKARSIALPGMPAIDTRTIVNGTPGVRPAINNLDEIAFTAFVKVASGANREAAFFLGRDGKLLPVAVTGESQVGGTPIEFVGTLTLNDAGMVGFRARRQGAATPNDLGG